MTIRDPGPITFDLASFTFCGSRVIVITRSVRMMRNQQSRRKWKNGIDNKNVLKVSTSLEHASKGINNYQCNSRLADDVSFWEVLVDQCHLPAQNRPLHIHLPLAVVRTCVMKVDRLNVQHCNGEVVDNCN